MEGPVLPHIQLSLRAPFLFPFWRGLPLRMDLFLIFPNPLEIPTVRFTISSPMVFQQILVVSFSFPRYSGGLPPSPYIRLLPRICCFRLRSFMPLLHSGISDVISWTSVLSRFRVPHCPSRIYFYRVPCVVPLLHSVILIRAAGNLQSGPQFS
jgi:hypothetical protein